MTTSSTSHTRYSWKKPASSWKKPMVKFVVSLVLLKRKKKKTAQPFNFMFLKKLWAFYNGGRGLFIGVDIYIYIYIFFFPHWGTQECFSNQFRHPNRREATIFGITHRIPNIQKTSYRTMRKLTMKQKMVHHFPMTMARVTPINQEETPLEHWHHTKHQILHLIRCGKCQIHRIVL